METSRRNNTLGKSGTLVKKSKEVELRDENL